MKDYKDTLNLPQTSFPMKASLATREPQFLANWEKQNLYYKIRQQNLGAEKFILHDGPPYANGDIHLGHAINKILKDITLKSKTFQGFDCPYVPGWDCHGLPIEREIEKKLGKPNLDVPAAKFRAACREFASKQVTKQCKDFMRLGVFAAWDQPYLTMSPRFEAEIVRALLKIYQSGYLQRGYKPVHWCSDCGSSLAEAEVEYQDRTSPSIYVQFPLHQPCDLLTRIATDPAKLSSLTNTTPVAIIIWTTTPWTLPANQAVAVNADFTYCLVKINDPQDGQDKYWILAEDLLSSVFQKLAIESWEVLTSFAGEKLELLSLNHPFQARQVPVILGSHVSLEDGTGCVHTAPAHGPDDYLAGLKYKLPIDHEIDERGRFKNTDLVAGLDVNQANPVIIEELKRQANLLSCTTVQHSYPHCWRHKIPVIFRATRQWFIQMDHANLRQECLTAIDQVKWLPNWGQARLAGMVGSRPDWCISRQRCWGTPIPIFVHKQTQQPHPETPALMEQAAKIIEKGGISAWHAIDHQTLLDPVVRDDYELANDTLDVWFESGVTHYAVLAEHPELRFPADLYLEGSDQYRGWFGSSLVTGVALTTQAPYKNILTHGFTIDASGRKMSKSLGNVIAPQTIIDQYGADILRLWVTATDYRSEMALSEEILKRVTDVYRRIRNTARFLLANISDFDPKTQKLEFSDLLFLDQWAIDHASSLQHELIAAYNEYNFHTVYQKIHNFCSLTMGSFYLDILKDRLYTTAVNSRARRSAQTAMYYIVQLLAQWIAPILSFTGEEIWQHLPGHNQDVSIYLSKWSNELQFFPAQQLAARSFWDKIMALKEAVNKQLEALRNQGLIGAALETEIIIYAQPELAALLAKLGDELRFVLITSYAQVQAWEERPATALATEIEGCAIVINKLTTAKCVRCWHYRAEIGTDPEHPELCQRCITNISAEHGELRNYA